MTDRTGAAELHRACRTHVIEYAASAAGAIEAGKRKYLATDKSAGLFGIHHLPGQRRRHHRPGRKDSPHKTRKHAVTPTNRAGATADVFTRCLPYQPWQHWSRLVGKVCTTLENFYHDSTPDLAGE